MLAEASDDHNSVVFNLVLVWETNWNSIQYNCTYWVDNWTNCAFSQPRESCYLFTDAQGFKFAFTCFFFISKTWLVAQIQFYYTYLPVLYHWFLNSFLFGFVFSYIACNQNRS